MDSTPVHCYFSILVLMKNKKDFHETVHTRKASAKENKHLSAEDLKKFEDLFSILITIDQRLKRKKKK